MALSHIISYALIVRSHASIRILLYWRKLTLVLFFKKNISPGCTVGGLIMDDIENSWDRGRAQGYLEIADFVVVERERIMMILERLFAYHFQGRNGLTMLDLGCGDGLVTEFIRSKSPESTFYLMDGSDFMLKKARQRLKGPGVRFLAETFQNHLDKQPEFGKYDFVYSMNAIHHLDVLEKKRLYCRVFDELKPGGLFVNSDPVTPASERSEEWQFNLWIDWMQKIARERDLKIEGGMIEKVPSGYKRKPENKPSGLFEQMQMLQEIGFQDVDCFYKYGIFTLFGGTKQHG
jgi:tRNA (cmo5U34)-methyltransferase